MHKSKIRLILAKQKYQKFLETRKQMESTLVRDQRSQNLKCTQEKG